MTFTLTQSYFIVIHLHKCDPLACLPAYLLCNCLLHITSNITSNITAIYPPSTSFYLSFLIVFPSLFPVLGVCIEDTVSVQVQAVTPATPHIHFSNSTPPRPPCALHPCHPLIFSTPIFRWMGKEGRKEERKKERKEKRKKVNKVNKPCTPTQHPHAHTHPHTDIDIDTDADADTDTDKDTDTQ